MKKVLLWGLVHGLLIMGVPGYVGADQSQPLNITITANISYATCNLTDDGNILVPLHPFNTTKTQNSAPWTQFIIGFSNCDTGLQNITLNFSNNPPDADNGDYFANTFGLNNPEDAKIASVGYAIRLEWIKSDGAPVLIKASNPPLVQQIMSGDAIGSYGSNFIFRATIFATNPSGGSKPGIITSTVKYTVIYS